MLVQESEENIIENFTVVWLDSYIDGSDANYQDSICQLRCIVNSIKLFVHIDPCIDYITDVKQEKVLMIVSDILARQLLPFINDIPQLYTIYVLSVNNTTDIVWMDSYHKVKGSFTQIECICNTLKQYVYQADRYLTSISIVSAISAVDSNQLDQSFMYSQLLKDILLKMKYDEHAKNEFVEFCRVRYKDNNERLRIIEEFHQGYNQASSIWWYTRDCFIYSMLNKALRIQDIDIILKMGFFLQNLHRQIEHLYLKSKDQHLMTIYRGQGISNADFAKLSRSKNGLLSFNNFLSTSTDRSIAYARAESVLSVNELTGVVFEMEINPLISSIPFASVDNVSYYFDSEEEILFSMHTIFRIGEMKQIEDRLWEVKLILTNDNDELLKSLTDCIGKELKEESERMNLGHLMFIMGELNKAEEIYKATLQSTSEIDLMNDMICCMKIGEIMSQKGDQKQALLYYQKAHEIQQKSFPSDQLVVALIHVAFGSARGLLAEYSTALSHYEAALKIYQKELPSNHPQLAILSNNIGLTYQAIGDYLSTIPYLEQALNIVEKILPPNHPRLGKSYGNLGFLHQSVGESFIALSYYEKALKIQQTSLPSSHPDIAEMYDKIGTLQHSMGRHSDALTYYKEAHKIRLHCLPSTHPSLATSYNNIAAMHQSMGEYPSALSHYNKALEIAQQSLTPNHPDLAKIYNNIGAVSEMMGLCSNALLHYIKALEINERTLLPTHPILAIANNSIGALYQSIGQYSKSLSYYKKALEINQQSLTPDHPSLAALYNNIGTLYESMTEYSNALGFHMKAHEIIRKTLPNDHVHLGMSHNNLAVVYHAMGDYNTASSHYQQAFEVYRKSLPPHHPTLASLHTNIGLLHQYTRQYSVAFLHFRKALEIQQKLFPPNHPSLAETYASMGTTYMSMEEYSKALPLLRRALDIGQTSLLSNHPIQAILNTSIAVCYENLLLYEQAVQHALIGLYIAFNVLGPTNPHVWMSQRYMERLLRKTQWFIKK